jgi:hypothetical protein
LTRERTIERHNRRCSLVSSLDHPARFWRDSGFKILQARDVTDGVLWPYNVIPLNERHFHRVVGYYNSSRPHRSLGGRASPRSPDDVLLHRLVECEVRDDLLQPPVLVLELAQPPDLGDPHPGLQR